MASYLKDVAYYGAVYGPCIWNGLRPLISEVPALFVHRQLGILSGVEGQTAITTTKELFPDIHDMNPNLRDDIFVFGEPNNSITFGNMASAGSNIGRAALIAINPAIFRSDEDMRNFFIKHEISHILNSDTYKAHLLAGTAATLSAFAVHYFKSCLPWWISPAACAIPWLVATNVYCLASLRFEAKADLFACQHALPEEIKGGLRFFIASQAAFKQLHKEYPSLATADGEFKQDVLHPPLSLRIKWLSAMLTGDENGTYEPTSDEIKKINTLQASILLCIRDSLKLKTQ